MIKVLDPLDSHKSEMLEEIECNPLERILSYEVKMNLLGFGLTFPQVYRAVFQPRFQ